MKSTGSVCNNLLIIRRIIIAIVALSISFYLTPLANASVIINEIMYNPSGDLGSDDHYEWIELYNIGSLSVNINGYTLKDADGHNYTFPADTWVSGHGYMILARNEDKFNEKYTVTCPVVDYAHSVSWNNDWDTVLFLDAGGGTVDSVTYYDSWGADGTGSSLERINPIGTSNDSNNWAPSVPTSNYGTPGAMNSVIPEPSTIILLGSGLIGLVGILSQRRKRREVD